MGVEREYPLEVLTQDDVVGPKRDEVMAYLETFSPRTFRAGEKAKAWLETNLETRVLPYPVHLIYSEDESRLLGFFVVHEIETQPPPRDVVYMQVRSTETGRKTIEDPMAASQPAMKLAWIVRAEDAPADIGPEMFDYAVELGEEAGCCAMIVEPFDDDTAQRLWIDHYGFIEGDGDDDEWSSCLWYALGEPNQTFN